MNPYESPPRQQPLPLAKEAPETETNEQSSVRNAFIHFVCALAIILLALFLGYHILAAVLNFARRN